MINVFGLHLKYPNEDPEIRKPERMNVAILSESKSKTSYAAMAFIDRILKLPEVIEIMENEDYKKLEINFDNASHFVSGEHLHFWTVDIPKRYEHFEEILFSPLAPHHGKTDLDRFFGNMKQSQTAYEYNNMTKSLKDLLNAYEAGKAHTNRIKELDGEEALKMHFLQYTLKRRGQWKYKIELPNIQSTHAVTYLREDNTIRNHILPTIDPRKGKDISSTAVKIELTEKEKNAPTDKKNIQKPFVEPKSNWEHVEKQRQNRNAWMKEMMKQPKTLPKKEELKYRVFKLQDPPTTKATDEKAKIDPNQKEELKSPSKKKKRRKAKYVEVDPTTMKAKKKTTRGRKKKTKRGRKKKEIQEKEKTEEKPRKKEKEAL